MDTAAQDWSELYRRYLSGTLTDDEQMTFYAMLLNPQRDGEIDRCLLQVSEEMPLSFQAVMDKDKASAIIDRILGEKAAGQITTAVTTHRIRFLRRGFVKYAAAIVLFITAAGGYYIFNKGNKHKEITQLTPSPENDVLPGTDKATLTLSSGLQVQLNSNTSEMIRDGDISIKNDNGLTYSQSGFSVSNTMTTPKGGQYKLTLADGSKVWLNAASSITFPTSFKGAMREVSIIGEAYLEIQPDKKHPFVVKTAREKIEVLGTAFNVNAYTDEPANRIALLEGSIKINQTILHPSQAYYQGKVEATNPDQDIAWINGRFDFDDMTLQASMRQLERWYDIEVIYKGVNPNNKLVGGMKRGLPLSEVLKMLKSIGINCELNNRTVTVMP